MTRTCAPILLAALIALAPALGLGGCSSRVAPKLTAPEQQLLESLTRDPFVRVEAITREEDGFLTVHTGQGSTDAYYRFMPAGDGKEDLVARRVDEAQELPVVWADGIGTGPEPRGLAR